MSHYGFDTRKKPGTTKFSVSDKKDSTTESGAAITVTTQLLKLTNLYYEQST